MKLEEFIKEVLESAEEFPWIKRIEKVEKSRVHVKLRLWLNESFVDVRYNSRTGSTSYAYIEGDKRLFGANNWKIGWHIHPYGEVKKHIPCNPLNIKEFLMMLEIELNKRGKI